MSKKILAFNWKMYLNDLPQCLNLLEGYEKLSFQEKVSIITFAPYIFLNDLVKACSNTVVGSQDISDIDGGSFTGQISGKMLSSFGCRYVLVGHCEARKFLKQTNMNINAKMVRALENNIMPILCVGYDEKETAGSLDFQNLENQLISAFEGIFNNFNSISELIIAYEPVWAIGSSTAASIEHISEVSIFIKKVLMEKFGSSFFGKAKILYGGSVDDTNIAKLNEIEVVDGFLVGRAGLDLDKVKKMVEVLS